MKPATALLLLWAIALCAGACVDTTSFTKFSSVPAWNVAGADVTIAVGSKVVLDVAPSGVLGVIRVSGLLYFSNNDMELKVKSVLVNKGGSLVVGRKDCPITKKIYITLHGYVNATTLGSDPDGGTPATGFGSKAIIVATGGSIEMFGAVNGPTWTTLSNTVFNGSRVLDLKEAVQWAVNDRIVIASTDFSEILDSRVRWNTTNSGGQKPMGTMVGPKTAEQSEEFVIQSITNGGKRITLNLPLNYTHWGNNYMFAEVGWLTRRIVVRGDDSSEATGFGGHCLFRNGPVVSISGVEFTRMGQKNVMSRYPVHFHFMGSVIGKGMILENSALHHLYQRCVTIHESDGVTIRNNVAYKTQGHCFFLEDGAETMNEFIGNLGIYAQAMFPPLLPHDVQPSIFWITNPNNSFVNNSASSAFIAYWMAMPKVPLGPFGTALWNTQGRPYLDPRNTGWGPLGFDGNIAHSLYKDGFHIDAMPNADETLDVGGWGKAFNVTRFICYKTRHGSVWSRFANGRYMDNVWLDSGEAHILQSDSQVIERTIFVGESDNIGLVTNQQYGRSMPNTNGKATYIGGYRGYDNGGSQTLVNCTFVNFTANAVRGAGAMVNSDNSQWGTTGLQKLFGIKYINSVSHYSMTQKLQFMFNGSANCLTYQDADGISLGITGGAWLVSNQTIYSTLKECKPNYDANGYTCAAFPAGFLSAQISCADPSTIVKADTKKYGSFNIDAVIFRLLGSSEDSPFFMSNGKTNIFSQKFYHFLPLDRNGRRTAINNYTTLHPRAFIYGDWMVAVLPYPAGTTFKIADPDWIPLTMATSLQNLTPRNPFWNTENNHLYVLMSNDQRGTPNNSTIAGYNRDGPYIGFNHYKINASCSDCSVDKYVIPPMPTTDYPTVLRKNSFAANLVSTHSSTVGHKGTLFGQLFPYSWWNYPMLTTQLWHSVFGNANDLYMTLEDQNGNRLTDNFIGHSTYTTTKRMSVDAWRMLVAEQVYVSIRRVRDNVELLRGHMQLSDKTEQKLVPPTFKQSATTCEPTHEVLPMFTDTFPAGDLANPSEWQNGTTMDKYCGTRSLYFNITKPTVLFVSNKQRNCRAPPLTPIPSKYVSFEFMVKAETPYFNSNNLVVTVSGNYYNASGVYVASPGISANWSNTANAVINSRGWTMVRVDLKELGGANITCINFNFNPWHSKQSFFIDNPRFSTIPAGDSFYDGPIIIDNIANADEGALAGTLSMSSSLVYSAVTVVVLCLMLM